MSRLPEIEGRKPSIFVFMAFMIAMVALCGTLVYAASIGAYSRIETRRAAADADRLHAIIVSAVQAVLREPETSLETASHFLALDPDHGQKSLMAIRESCDYFVALLELDAAGIVVREDFAPAPTAAWPGAGTAASPYRGADFSSTPFMEAMRSSDGVRWSSIHAGLDEGRREIYGGLRSGEGFIMGIMDFEVLAARLSELLGDNATGLSLTDQTGTFIVNRDMDKVDRRETELDFLTARLADPDGGVYRYTKKEGNESLEAVARRIPGVGWFAIVERPVGYAREALRQSLPLVSTLSLLSIGLAAGLASIAMRKLFLDVKAAGSEASRQDVAGSVSSLYFRETDSIMKAARDAAMRIRAEEEANERLAGLNAQLGKALRELAETQQALVASEREALQGAMSAALAHELNTPIAATVSAAAMTEAAAQDLLSFLSEAPCPAGELRTAALSLGALATAYDPESMPSGVERREAARVIQDMLAGRLGGADAAVGGADASLLAGRLVDLGAPASGSGPAESLAAAMATGVAAPALACLTAAEIVASSRVILSAMASAHSVVGSLREYTVPETLGGKRPVRVASSLEGAIALLYAHTRRGVELKLDLGADPWIDAEPGTVKRIWLGMIAEALDAISYRGRIEMGVYSEGGRAVVRFSLPDADAGDRVPDDACGDARAAKPGGMSLESLGRLVGMTGGELSSIRTDGRLIHAISFPERTGGGATGAKP